MRKVIFVVLISFCFASNLLAQSLNATLNKTKVGLGQPVVLTLSVSGQVAQNPNLDVLDSDFKVISVANSYNTQIINGYVSQNLEYQITMLPKSEGKIIIPVIELGKLKSNQLNLEVMPADFGVEEKINTTQSATKAFKIDAKIDNKTPYIQQQINYSVFLYDSGGLEGREPGFADNSDWIIKTLGQPKIESKETDGKQVREIRFDYALFAQKSGKLIVPSFEFEGYYLTKSAQANPFDAFFGSGFLPMAEIFATKNPIFLKTKPIEIDVKPAVLEAKGKWWLPAKNVELASKVITRGILEVGKPIKREIYLKAVGVIDTQLPIIKSPDVPNLRQYPQKPISQNRVEDGFVVASEKIEYSYIPGQGGEIILPEITVDWFDIDEKIMKKAVLKSETLNVIGVNVANEPEKVLTSQKNTLNHEKITKQVFWKEYFELLIVFGSAVLFAIYLLICSNKKNVNYYAKVIKSAQSKDLKSLQADLLEWGKNFYKQDNLINLKNVAKASKNKLFEQEMDKLFEELYSEAKGGWKAGDFIRAFKIVAKRKKNKLKKEILPKLYK